jgi:hypothetical protein
VQDVEGREAHDNVVPRSEGRSHVLEP